MVTTASLFFSYSDVILNVCWLIADCPFLQTHVHTHTQTDTEHLGARRTEKARLGEDLGKLMSPLCRGTVLKQRVESFRVESQ